jgi:hypothetical protein
MEGIGQSLINSIKGTGFIAKNDTWETEEALNPYMAQISTFLKSEKDETVETASIFRNQPVEMVIDLCSSDEEVKTEKKARPTLKKLKKVFIAKRFKKIIRKKSFSNTTTVARTLLLSLFGAEKNEIIRYLDRELNFLEEY